VAYAFLLCVLLFDVQCFNQLDLSAFSSIDIMREKLMLALREGSQGFGFR